MKFTDGVWQSSKGVRIYQAAQARDWQFEEKSLTLYASTEHLIGRGIVDNIPQIAVRVSAPLPGVVRVQLTHFKGTRACGPSFQIAENDAPPETSEDANTLVLRSGKLEARIEKLPWRISFLYDGRPLTESACGNLAYVLTEDDGPFVREQLELAVGECVYGLGERFTAFVKNGQRVEMWNRDGGTSTDQAYKNIPFYVTNRGYGVLVNHPENVSFEVGTERVAKVQFSVPGEHLDYFVIGGAGLKEVLANYTALTGRPALPPAWSFGLWLSTSFTTDYTEATVSHFVDGMRERGIPLSVFHFDPYWMKALQWCDFEWDRQTFPDPEGMIRRLKERGLHLCLWINPYIAQQSPLFDEGMEHGYLLKTPSGGVWQTDLWQPGMGIVDFTNPAAREWYAAKLHRLVEMGIDTFKTDFGERIPTDVVYYDGSDPVKMHNYYTLLYNQTVFGMLERAHGPGGAVIFGRSATVGSQRFPTQWGGDNLSQYPSMAETLRAGLSFGLTGFGFWSHDIGGFDGTATPDLYKRWIAFGLTSSHSRLHGMSSYRVPWLFDEESVDVLRYFTRLKCRLMPYLYAAAVEATRHGLPVLRAMVLEFEHDPACEYLDRQYMLGGSLLVAPVFSPDGAVSFYLPEGTWINFFTGEQVQGGVWRQEQHGYLSLPLYVRPAGLIALGSVDGRPDYDFASDVELHLFALQDGAQAVATVYSPTGEEELHVVCTREGNRIALEETGAGKPWALVLRGVPSVTAVRGAGHEPGAGGVKILPSAGVHHVEIDAQY